MLLLSHLISVLLFYLYEDIVLLDSVQGQKSELRFFLSILMIFTNQYKKNILSYIS